MSVTAPAPRTDWHPPQVPAYDPSQGDMTKEYGLYPTQLIEKPQGYPAMPMDAREKLRDAGWWQCPTAKVPVGKGRGYQPCGFWVSPQAKTAIEGHNGYFTCPKCSHSYNMMEELPWHGPEDAEEAFGTIEPHESGGGTRIGIPMTDQAQIGENLVAQMSEIPGYGAITWWHPGGAGANSSLDGATSEWGIEVKTLSYDATHHRFVPGGEGEHPRQYTEDKNSTAREMGLKGVLGVLVLLDYRRDVADIYVKAMPLEPWETRPGQFTSGVAQFRKNSAQKLVAEVPFPSPYKDPHHPGPGPYRASDYYESPQPQMPSQLQQAPASDMPF